MRHTIHKLPKLLGGVAVLILVTGLVLVARSLAPSSGVPSGETNLGQEVNTPVATLTSSTPTPTIDSTATPVPSSTPTPDPSLTTYQNNLDGYSINYPKDWTLLPADHSGGAVTLFNWTQQPPFTEGLPTGGAKVDIYPIPFPIPAGGKPYAVGAAGYPGTIFIDQPVVAAPSGVTPEVGITDPNMHSIEIFYQAAGKTWHISGGFREAPDQANLNTALFYDIVRSIRYAS